jgi:hypothetical protein
MGLVMNPVAFRVGHFHSWMDAWFMHRMYYPEFLHNVLLLKTLMFFLFYDLFFMDKYMFFLYSHLNLLFKNDRIFMNVFVYDCTDRTFFYDWLNYLNYDKFKRVKLKTFWLKNRLLSDNDYSLDFFLLLYHLNINFDEMEFENIEVKYSWRLQKKIEHLRKKYGEDFIAREEIVMLERLLLFLKDGFYKFGNLFIVRYFLKWYYKNKRKKLLRFPYKKYKIKNKSNYLFYKNVKYNYMFLFLILSIFDIFLSRSSPTYPYVQNFNRLENMYAIRFFFYWFVLRSVYFVFSKFVELILIKFGIRAYCRFFVLNNSCIIALFIARFIAIGIYSRFSFKDLMIPIRRSLHRLMYIRVYKKLSVQLVKKFNEYKLRKSENNVFLVKNYLKNRFIFFMINFIIVLNEIKADFNFLLWKKSFNFFLKKNYRFFKIINFFKSLKYNFIKRNYFNNNKKYIISKKKNKLKFLKLIIGELKIKIFNNNFKEINEDFDLLLLYFYKYKQLKLLNNNLFFNNENIYILEESLFLKNLKFFYFFIFKKIFNKLYFIIKFITRKITFRNYKKLILKKSLKKHFFLNWIPFKLTKKEDKHKHLLFNTNRIFLLITKMIKEKKKFILYNNDKKKLKKYKFILKILKTFLQPTDRKMKFLMGYEMRIFKKLAHLIKLRKIKMNLKVKKYKNLRKFRRILLKKRIKIRKAKNIIKKRKNYINNLIYLFYDNKLQRRQINQFFKFVKINLLYLHFFKKYILQLNLYNKFSIKISKLFNYINNLNNANYLYKKQFYKTNEKLITDKLNNEIMTPIKYKLKRRKYLDKSRAILYGYKFHFRGRFKRKQKASNLWFVKGAMPNSTMIQEVDRGFFTFYSMFGACTVRVWLYKGDNSPKYIIRVN